MSGEYSTSREYSAKALADFAADEFGYCCIDPSQRQFESVIAEIGRRDDRVLHTVLKHYADCEDPEHKDSIREILEDLAELFGLPEEWWERPWSQVRASDDEEVGREP